MKIEYSVDEKHGGCIVYARTKTDSESKFAEGVDPDIARGLINLGHVGADALDDIERIVKRAKAHGDDVETATPERGKEVARDKAIADYFNRLTKINKTYIAALEKELERAKRQEKFIEQRIANAKERLSEY